MSRATKLILVAVALVNLVVIAAGAIGALQRNDLSTAATAAITLTALGAISFAMTQRQLWPMVLAIAFSATSLGIVHRRPLTGLLIATGVVLLALWWTSRELIDITSMTSSTAIDPATEAAMAGFSRLGYVQAGAFSFALRDSRRVPAALMVGPKSDRYVVVTDLVTAITSRFGARTLVTRNSGHTRPPPDALVNDVQGADAGELDRSHERALQLLTKQGLTPDQIQVGSLVAEHIEREKHWLTNNGPWKRIAASMRTGSGEGPLDRSDTAPARIKAWLAYSDGN